MQWRHWRLSRRKPSNYILLTDQVLVMLKFYFRTLVAYSVFFMVSEVIAAGKLRSMPYEPLLK